jgi:hypothetical protein
MKKLLLLIFVASLLYGRAFFAESFQLSGNEDDLYPGIGSNGISDIWVMNDSTILLASGAGLSISRDAGESFYTYYSATAGMAYGGVSAIATLGNHIWIATAFDSAGVEEVSGTGGGISHSPDGGLTWRHFRQPMDHPDSNFVIVNGDTVRALPIVVPIDNITYDLAVTINSKGDTILYAASFAGGARRSADLGESWKRVILPPDNQDILNANSPTNFDYTPVDRPDLNLRGNYNHESFSVVARDDFVAIGTAAGINVSYDDGKSWRKYNANNSGITGNFVVALHLDPYGNLLAGTLPALGANEYRSLAYSYIDSMGVLYWRSALDNIRVYNISSWQNSWLVSSSFGGWISKDGWSWAKLAYPVDRVSGERLYSNEIYALQGDSAGYLWAGTGDGLARTDDWGLSWDLIRRVSGFADGNKAQISAYPNPFSPSRMNLFDGDGFQRFLCYLPQDGDISIDVFDFAMKKVRSVASGHSVNKGYVTYVWNGRNGLNEMAANGTYFVRLLYENSNENSTVWTKIIILE